MIHPMKTIKVKSSEDNGSKPQQEQNLKEQFQQFAQMTRNAMSQMNQDQMNVNIAGLQYILYSLLNLSLEQEELSMYTSSTESRSQAYVGMHAIRKMWKTFFRHFQTHYLNFRKTYLHFLIK